MVYGAPPGLNQPSTMDPSTPPNSIAFPYDFGAFILARILDESGFESDLSSFRRRTHCLSFLCQTPTFTICACLEPSQPRRAWRDTTPMLRASLPSFASNAPRSLPHSPITCLMALSRLRNPSDIQTSYVPSSALDHCVTCTLRPRRPCARHSTRGCTAG